MAIRLGLLLAVALSSNGCGDFKSRETSPEATVRAMSVALGEKDYRRAYGLMSRDYRERVSFEAFVGLLTGNPEDVSKLSNSLSQIREPSAQQATVVFGEEEQLSLVREGAKWRIATDFVNFYDQSTPRAALRTFLRAVERERYDVAMRLIPDADQEGVTADRLRETWTGEGREELERTLSNLRNHLDDPIEQVGDHATMPYGEGLRVQFIRERGLWKIEDPD